MNKIENQQPSSPAPQETSVVAATVASGSRRRLLRGGMVAAPTLLALTTTPVLASNCKLPSGFSASGNLSQTKSNNCAAPGIRPSVRKTMTEAGSKSITYKGTTILTTCTFDSVFGGSDKSTFTRLLSLPNADLDPRALAVAVYLESIGSGGQYFPVSGKVKEMWTNTEGSGTYTAVQSPEVLWKRSDVVQYFKYLTGVA